MARVIDYNVQVSGTDEAAQTLADFEKKAEGTTIKLNVDSEALEESLENAVKTGDQIEKIGTGIAGAFGVATGVVGAFGDQLGFSAEQIEEAQANATSFIAILTGIKPVIEGVQNGWKLFNTLVLANPIGLVVAGVAALAAGVLLVISYWDELTGVTDDAIENLKEANKLSEDERNRRQEILKQGNERRKQLNEEAQQLIKLRKSIDERYDAEIAAARASGKETGAIEAAKRAEIIKTNRAIVENAQKQIDGYIETLALVNKISKEQAVELIRQDALFGPIYDNAIKRINELNNEIGDAIDANRAALTKTREQLPELENVLAKPYTRAKEALKELQQQQQEGVNIFAVLGAAALEQSRIDREAREKEINDARAVRDAKIQFAQDTFSVVNGVNELLNAAGVEAVGLQKTIALAQIAFDTGKAISGAIASAQTAGPFPANIAAIATGVAAVLAGIASAIKTVQGAPKVPGASGAGGSTPALPSPNLASQAFNAPTASQNGLETPRMFVSVVDINNTQNKLNVSEQLSRL
jgi:hypothetical protein